MIGPGTQVGSYRLVQQIGEGGMGAVWLAEHVMLGRRVAIKVLHESLTTEQTVVTRFFNEARAATAIADAGIVQIFDFGYHTDGSAYIVMELLEGEPLDRRLRRSSVLPPLEALRIIRQVAASVGAAHARGIVHRDLKPENVFLVRDAEVPGGERAKVLDFGIAKLLSDQHQNIGVKTQQSAVIGTPDYMSPEQCKGAGEVDARSDIYSLGCVLFCLVAGHPPYRAQGLGEIFLKHVLEPTPTLAGVVPGVGPELDQLIGKCMAKDPAQRFASCAELSLAIDLLLGRQPYPAGGGTGPSHVVPRLSGHGDAAQAAQTTLSASASVLPQTQAPPSSQLRKRGALIAGSATVLIVAGGLVIALQGRGADAEAPAAAPAPAPATAPEPALAPAPDQPTPDEVARGRVRAVLVAFGEWARTHAGAPCPTVEALAVADRVDPWQQPLQLTCTDQPGDQQIGVRSAGADGALGTADDITSWTMSKDITSLVHGARWTASAPGKPASEGAKAGAAPARPAGKKPRPKGSATGEFIDIDGDGIPDKR
jgi:eukaryotic-like serine/threonine-protein kinase